MTCIYNLAVIPLSVTYILGSTHNSNIYLSAAGKNMVPIYEINVCKLTAVKNTVRAQLGAKTESNDGETAGSVADTTAADTVVELVDPVQQAAEDGFTLTDEFRFINDGNELCEHFITHLDVTVQDNAFILGGRYQLCCDADAELFTDKMDFTDDAAMLNKWPTGYITRLGFRLRTGAATRVSFVLKEL